MAEGEDPRDNPFSFRNFGKKRNHRSSNSDDFSASDDEDELAPPEPLQDLESNDHQDNGKQSKSEENPFSFKKFLSSSSNGAGPRPRVTTGLSNLDLASDLPDFIQDHPASTSPPGCPSVPWPRRPPPDSALPDFALQGSSSVNPFSVPSGLNSSISDVDLGGHVTPPGMDLHVPHMINIDRELGVNGALDQAYWAAAGSPNRDPLVDSDAEINHEDPDEILSLPQANATGGLPDFLSDSAVNTVDQRNSEQVWGDYSLANGDYKRELRMLRDENEELRVQLELAREEAKVESNRVSELTLQMESMKKREAADTAALENMMHQVECNLSETTERALLADDTVAKLRLEVKTLKFQLETGGGAQASFKPCDEIIKEKTKYASEQLATAAKNAEQTLQQLMSGVETLKLVSSVLASIDKVTDAGAQGNTDNSAGSNSRPGGASAS